MHNSILMSYVVEKYKYWLQNMYISEIVSDNIYVIKIKLSYEEYKTQTIATGGANEVTPI